METIKKFYSPQGGYGPAINYVHIDSEGKMWVDNGEYATQVNFHPWTGEPSPKQMEKVNETDKFIEYN